MTITEEQMRGIAAQLVDTYVDVDGAAGNQCWDSQAYINSHFFGLPIINTGGVGRWPGWAGNMVDAFPQSPAIAAAYELVSPDQPCQPGDTLVWGDSYPAWYPKTHVATCVMDPGNGWPLCLSQNSSTGRPDLPGYSPESTGPVILQSLPKQGLIGIIRPRDTGSINFQSTPKPQEDALTPEQMQELKVFIQEDNEARHVATRKVVESAAQSVIDAVYGFTTTLHKQYHAAALNEMPAAVVDFNYRPGANLAGALDALAAKPDVTGAAAPLDPQAVAAAFVDHVNIQITKK